MSDKSIFNHISALVAEEFALRERATGFSTDNQRIRSLESDLDQCWHLLRERRAQRRETGGHDDRHEAGAGRRA